MHARVLRQLVGVAAGLGGLTAVCCAQPQRLYVWPSSPHNGELVLDASLGGGAENFTWGILLQPDRTLVGWGNNKWGQLGFVPSGGYQSPCDTNPEYCYLPTLVNGVIPGLRMISAGWNHNLGLSDDSTYANSRGLVGWGRNDSGHPCEIPMFNSSGTPQGPWNIDANAKVKQISAGEFVNIVLFDNGQIAAWGDSTYGVHPPSNGTSGSGRYDPYIPPSTWRFKKVAAGGHFVMALILDAPSSGLPTDSVTGRTGEGWIVSWGSWTYQQGTNCGPGFRVNSSYTSGFTTPYNGANLAAPYKPPYDDIFAGHIVCGGIIRNATSLHAQLYPNETFHPGTLHMWGSNSLGAISDKPADLTFEQVVGGYSSWAQGVALMDYTDPQSPVTDQTIHSWGGWPDPNGPPQGWPSGDVAGKIKLLANSNRYNAQGALCYDPNCDGSTNTPVLTANDFQCFLNEYAAAQSLSTELRRISYANCDGSTASPVITVNDFYCFLNKYAVGACP